MEDMNDILNPPQEETTQEVETEREETQEKQEQETGEKETQVAAETKEEKQGEAKPDATADAVRAELAALTKERERLRQKEAALEAEREKLSKPAQQEEEKPDFWDDPQSHLSAVEQRFEQRLQEERFNISEVFARQAHPDFQEKVDLFAVMVKENPALYQQMLNNPSPAEFLYQTAAEKQKVAKLQELGDPEELRARIREEERAKVLAEIEAEKAAAVEAKIKEKLSKGGFSEQRSVGSERTTTKTYNGPTPMGKILG